MAAAGAASMAASGRACVRMGAARGGDLCGEGRELLFRLAPAFRADGRGLVQPPVQVAEHLAAFLALIFVDGHLTITPVVVTLILQ